MMRRRQNLSPGPRGDAGFTIIEVLISIVLLALILSTTQSALRFGQRSWEISDDMERIDATGAVLKFVEQRLTQTMPLYQREADGRLRVAFWGGADSVKFIAPSVIGSAGGGLYRFELIATSDADGRHGLTLRWRQYQPISSNAVDDERLLIPDIDNLSFRYFGQVKPGDAPSWVDEWSRTDSLPDLVELRLVARNRHWTVPSIVLVELQLRPRS